MRVKQITDKKEFMYTSAGDNVEYDGKVYHVSSTHETPDKKEVTLYDGFNSLEIHLDKRDFK